MAYTGARPLLPTRPEATRTIMSWNEITETYMAPGQETSHTVLKAGVAPMGRRKLSVVTDGAPGKKAGVQLSVVRKKLNVVADGGRRKLSVVTDGATGKRSAVLNFYPYRTRI